MEPHVATTTRSSMAIPLTMRAAVIDKYGGPDKLKIREIPVPRPKANEVLIRVDTAGVGTWDIYFRNGEIKSDHGFPLVLGTDGSGVVADAGSRVTRFKRGDRVYAYAWNGGFYAEYVAVAATSVGRVPTTLALQRAGALGVVGLTALQGVDDALDLERGKSIIVHAASGNVGMIAVQLAKWRGARVLATASGKDGVAFVRRLGIANVINGKKDDVARAARELFPGGVDVVLAFAGGRELQRCIDTLKKGGHALFPNGIEPEPRKRKNIRIKSYNDEATTEAFGALHRAIVATKLEVPIARSFPLERAANAHRLVERGHLLGRVIFRP